MEATLRQARHIYAARAGFTRYPQANANLSGERKSVNNAARGQTGDENTLSAHYRETVLQAFRDVADVY